MILFGMYLLLAATSVAQAEPAEVALARQAYLAADFNLALRHYDRAVSKTSQPAELAQLHVSRALCFSALQDPAGVSTALTRALEKDPELQLDPDRVDPSLLERFQALRDRLRGTLEVHAQPADSQVWLDGAPLHPLPFRGDISLGSHTLEAQGVNGRRVSQAISVAANGSHTVTLVIPEAPASSPPPSASAPGPVLAEGDAGAPSLFAEVRLNASSSGGVSPEADVLFTAGPFRAAGGLLLGSSPALVLRLGAQTQPFLLERGRLYATLNGVLFSEDRFSLLGPGATVGATWAFHPRWTGVAELSGWQLYTSERLLDRYLVATLGVQVQLTPVYRSGKGTSPVNTE